MEKTRLQELCHSRRWAPPDYTVRRDGPDHAPSFSASVTVNGLTFHAPDPSRSSKDAQAKAAHVANNHLAAVLAPRPPPLATAKNQPQTPSPQPAPQSPEERIGYKAELHVYAQKNCFELPKYDAVRVGDSHAPRFKASVAVDGHTFHSQHFFGTLKEAQNDAAKVALSSLSPEENVQEKTHLYKNMLHELATKEGFSVPRYRTTISGECHMPTFSSTVEVGGSSFVGDVAKSKKQAETNAAKIALLTLKERFGGKVKDISRCSTCSDCGRSVAASSESLARDINDLKLASPLSIPSSPVKLKQNPVVASSETLTKDINDSKLASSLSIPSFPVKRKKKVYSDEKQMDENAMKNGSAGIHPEYQGLHLTAHAISDGNFKRMAASTNKLDEAILKNKSVTAEDTASQKINTRPSRPSEGSNNSVRSLLNENSERMVASTNKLDGNSERMAASTNKLDEKVLKNKAVTAEGTASHDRTVRPPSLPSDFNDDSVPPLLSNRVRIYPRKPDMVLPEGVITLPVSDDTWVAMSLDFSMQKDTCEETGLPIEIDSSTVSIPPPVTRDELGADSAKEFMVNGSGQIDVLDNEVIRDASSEDETISIADISSEPPTRGSTCTFQANRVIVHPYKPDIVPPEGASRLPCSDDQWVAFSFDSKTAEV